MRHTKKRVTHHRRRKVGALNPGNPIVKIAAVAAGYFFADQINTSIDGVIPASISSSSYGPYIPLAGELGIGGYLLMKGRPSLPKALVGGVLVGAGLKRALKKFGIIAGYQAVPVIGARKKIHGYQQTPVIGMIPNQLTGYRVNGIPDQLSGYVPAGSGQPAAFGAVTPYESKGYNPYTVEGSNPFMQGSAYLR